MSWRRDWRFLGLHVFTWVAMGGVLALALFAQAGHDEDYLGSHFGWPMEVVVRDYPNPLFTPMGWTPRVLPPPTYVWNGRGALFNTVFFAGLLVAAAIVVERLIRNWLKLWQFSLAALLWTSSVFGATIAIVSQDYLPVVLDCFQYLDLKPRSELHLHTAVRIPIYFGIACLLYVIADSTFRAAAAAFEWWRQSKLKGDARIAFSSMRLRR